MTVSGVLEILERGGGFLRDPARSFAPSRQDVFVPAALINRFQLISGALVSGSARPERPGPRLDNVELICGLEPEAFQNPACTRSAMLRGGASAVPENTPAKLITLSRFVRLRASI